MDLMQLKQMSLLVVTGEPTDCQQLQLYLGRKLHVSCVATGEEALTHLERQPVDLLLLADHLPDRNSFDLLRTIHAKERYRDLPIIIVTGDHSQKTEAASAMAGAFDLIRKPFIPIIVVVVFTTNKICHCEQRSKCRSNSQHFFHIFLSV